MAGVDVGTISQLLNVTVQRIGQLLREPGCPPKLARNEYDAQKMTLWYIRHLQQELRRRGPAGTAHGADMLAEKLKLTAAQAEKVHTENMVRRGDLLEVSAVRDVWAQLIGNARARLRAIPSTEGPQLTNRSQPAYIVERLRIAIDQACSELADFPNYGRPDQGDTAGVDSVAAIRPAAEPDGEPMGGHEAPAIE